jgi:hypothetical protein
MDNNEIRRKIAKLKGIKLVDKSWYYANGVGLSTCRNWPESIAGAWELMEEMSMSEFVEIRKRDNTWIVDIDNGSRTISPDADTAPRAISLAYISWKEAQG